MIAFKFAISQPRLGDDKSKILAILQDHKAMGYPWTTLITKGEGGGRPNVNDTKLSTYSKLSAGFYIEKSCFSENLKIEGNAKFHVINQIGIMFLDYYIKFRDWC